MADERKRENVDTGDAAALIGEPISDALSRGAVDDLEFSAKHQDRPEGMSREEYIASRPGRKTRDVMATAGVVPWSQAKRIAVLTLALVGVLAGAALFVWLLSQ